MTDVQLTHKLGFIGYRNHAKKLIDIAEKNYDFEITNIYHPTKRIDDPRITNNLEKLYDCDGVIIASPNSTHFEYIQKLIKNSKCFIFCEKPPVTSLEGIKFLENLAPEDKKRIFFNFQLRFSKINEILKQYLNSEKLGKIIQINIISSMGFAFKEKYVGSWRADGKNNLHNMIENVSIHWIDLMIFNFGKSIGASYFPRLMSNHGSSYDTNSLILKFENGITVSIFNSYVTPLIEDVVVIGTNSFVTIRDNAIEIFSPRDTFNENGLFTKPKNRTQTEFSFESNRIHALKSSVDYFLEHVKNSEGFEPAHFMTSINSNKLVLELENS